MPIILIDNYDSFTYNLYQMIQALTAETVEVYRNDALDLAALVAKKPSRLILSPGPGHPGQPKDFGVCADIIRSHDALQVPVMGVCLGHQGMAHYLGGEVVQAPAIMHGKSSAVSILVDSPILAGLPNPFQAMRYHSLVVSPDSLPACFTVTAKDCDHHLIMAMQHREKPLYGVQFHPESIGTPEGSQVLRNFIERC